MAIDRPDCARLVIRTDNGSQYVSKKFRGNYNFGCKTGAAYLASYPPQQNGYVESFHKTLKKEYLWPYEFANYQDAESVISKAFDDYNNYRIHSALRYITPDEFIEQWEMRNR